MSENLIAFISSDARELFKADIYRVLALPQRYVIRFRYERKYIDGDILSKLENLRGQEAVIFFATGNNTKTPIQERVITFESLRKVVIRESKVDHNINLVHFYLELGEFIKCIPNSNLNELIASQILVKEINASTKQSDEWINRIEKVRSAFPNELFYTINSIKRNGLAISPEFSKLDKASYYHLIEESQYQMELSFYDTTGGSLGLAVIGNDDSKILLDVPKPHHVSSDLDSSIFNLYTYSITQKEEHLVTLIKPTNENCVPKDVYAIQLHWKLDRGKSKNISFALLSVLTAIGIAGLRLFDPDVLFPTCNCINCFIPIISLAAIGVGSFFLYQSFNKK